MNNPIDLNDYVKNMSNQIFLSENQLGALYVMLLLKKRSSWDQILPCGDTKDKMAGVLKSKIVEVEQTLEILLRAYEEKLKSSHFSWLQRFMDIVKAKNKSMYIYVQKAGYCNRSHKEPVQASSDSQLLRVLYGISNITSLSGMGLGKFSQFNNSQRYITFSMGRRYSLTIKNDDAVYKDTSSQLSVLPREMFINHIMVYFSAYELFGMREVCKEWEGYVKESWHGSFKREMFSQLLASEFCKDIEFYYKLLQLRNPFFHKLSLLLHALIEIIQWDKLKTLIQSGNISIGVKRVFVVLLLLLGEKLPITNLNQITDVVWNAHVHLLVDIKERVAKFFSDLTTSVLSISQLKAIKTNFLDNPFMRVEQHHSDDKDPLLLFIFVNQFTLQSILKNHIILTQEYLYLSKKRLDQISKNWPTNRGFLEGAYKVLLLKTKIADETQRQIEQNSTPDFSTLLKSVMNNQVQQYTTPDFVINGKSSSTNVYLDNRTKWDIIISTVKKSEEDSNATTNELGQQPSETLQPVQMTTQTTESEAPTTIQPELRDHPETNE